MYNLQKTKLSIYSLVLIEVQSSRISNREIVKTNERNNMNYKEYHKELKKKVNIAIEQVRNEDRTNKTLKQMFVLLKS